MKELKKTKKTKKVIVRSPPPPNSSHMFPHTAATDQISFRRDADQD